MIKNFFSILLLSSSLYAWERHDFELAIPISYENALTTSAEVDPQFFTFIADFGVLLTQTEEEFFAIKLDDGSVWGTPLRNPDSFSILKTWTYGDWVTLLPSSFVPGEYILENHVRSPGQILSFKNFYLPNAKNNIIQDIYRDESLGEVIVKIKDKFFIAYQPSHIAAIRNWEIGDAVYVNKTNHFEKNEEFFNLFETLILMNITKKTSAEVIAK